ncbi:MAG: hypothetical protein CMC76_11995 [Flavobacteriaceae bacterium]|nr:hypothetical protein [Flavobacteriaceae bacterium]|tara:strand:- start:4681 stop:6972 length:2292 start_codon:yes stop_codon:yes gene_type:complete
MSNIDTAYNDRVYYELQNTSIGNLPIPSDDVIGWNEDEKEYARNEDYEGIFAKFSNALRFKGTAKDWINNLRATQGINAKGRLVKNALDNQLVWQRDYGGFLSMRSWEFRDNVVSMKFESGGLENTLKARRKDKVELERTETYTGKPIPELEVKKLNLPGRRIFLETDFSTDNVNNEAKCRVQSNDGSTRAQVCGIPLQLTGQSHDLANSVFLNSTSNELQGTTGMMFYALNDRTRLMDISLDFNFDAYFQQYENVQWCRYQVCLTVYDEGANYNVKERRVIYELRSSGEGVDGDLVDGGVSLGNLPSDFDAVYPSFTIPIAGSYTTQIELLEGESMALECLLQSDMYVDVNAGVRCYAQNIVSNLKIEEDSYYEPTLTNGLLAYELLERLVEIMTGDKTNFKSSYYGRVDRGYAVDGPGAYTFFAHGHWIRQFTAEDELYKPFATSFLDAFESLEVLHNIGLGIERIGFKERIIVEDSKYFNNNNVTIRLGKEVNGTFEYQQVKNVERKVNEDYYYSSITIGSDKGGDYEEVMGLQETNTQANFTTIIEGVANEYKKTAKYRWDPYGEEIIRRRNKITAPTTDQSGDLDIWAHDVKPSATDILELKTWQDVLEVEPVGMFDPDSSYNFLWSPVQLLLKHGYKLNAGLKQYPYDSIIFGSSTGKSQVTIQSIGNNAYSENGNIPNADLEQARDIPEEISFEFTVDRELIKKIEGYTVLANGDKIPNIYGKIEFKNEFGELEKGKIISIKPNGKGQFTLIKSAI